jgi:hypothetical protein
VNSTNQAYDFFQPWQKKSPFSRRGIGVVIPDGRILVTAELITNSNFIELEKAATAEKSTAVIERVDYDCNLAILRPADSAFLEAMPPIEFDGKTQTRGLGDKLSSAQLSAIQNKTFFGNDVDPKMIRLATMNLTLRGLPNVRILLRNVLTTSFDNERKAELGLPHALP